MQQVNKPQWVRLANGKTKLFNSQEDAKSWAIQQKSTIRQTMSFMSEEPNNILKNPSNESVIESHILQGGKMSDFVSDFQ